MSGADATAGQSMPEFCQNNFVELRTIISLLTPTVAAAGADIADTAETAETAENADASDGKLAASPGHGPACARLRRRLVAHHSDTGCLCAEPNSSVDAARTLCDASQNTSVAVAVDTRSTQVSSAVRLQVQKQGRDDCGELCHTGSFGRGLIH